MPAVQSVPRDGGTINSNAQPPTRGLVDVLSRWGLRMSLLHTSICHIPPPQGPCSTWFWWFRCHNVIFLDRRHRRASNASAHGHVLHAHPHSEEALAPPPLPSLGLAPRATQHKKSDIQENATCSAVFCRLVCSLRRAQSRYLITPFVAAMSTRAAPDQYCTACPLPSRPASAYTPPHTNTPQIRIPIFVNVKLNPSTSSCQPEDRLS